LTQAIFMYAKAYPELTLEELENTFRDADMNTYLIAKEQDISNTHTIIDLQGEQGQKFVVSFQFSNKPKRAKFAEGWPSTPEENLTRLTESGFVVDSFAIICRRCDEVGHTSATCEQEKVVVASTITCANCNEGTTSRFAAVMNFANISQRVIVLVTVKSRASRARWNARIVARATWSRIVRRMLVATVARLVIARTTA
jgi:hypothetical protein